MCGSVPDTSDGYDFTPQGRGFSGARGVGCGAVRCRAVRGGDMDA
jgi:hypothetical protein